MGAGETTEGHRVETLPGEAGIADAEVADTGAVEGHRQQTGELHRRDRAVAALEPAEKTAVASRRPNLLVGDRSSRPGRMASRR